MINTCRHACWSLSPPLVTHRLPSTAVERSRLSAVLQVTDGFYSSSLFCLFVYFIFFFFQAQAIHPDCAIISAHLRAQEMCSQTRGGEAQNQTDQSGGFDVAAARLKDNPGGLKVLRSFDRVLN